MKLAEHFAFQTLWLKQAVNLLKSEPQTAHLKDYRQAINENTAFLMKVHCSNYHISGFTASVSEQELVDLGRV